MAGEQRAGDQRNAEQTFTGAAISCGWVLHRRPLDWLVDMVKYTSMSTTMRKEWLELLAKQ
jgi:hypothetical protein